MMLMRNTNTLFKFGFFFAELKIMEGKLALYKRGYHIVLRRLKRLIGDKKRLKKEVSRLRNIVQMHEDLTFLF